MKYREGANQESMANRICVHVIGLEVSTCVNGFVVPPRGRPSRARLVALESSIADSGALFAVLYAQDKHKLVNCASSILLDRFLLATSDQEILLTD